MHKLDAAINDYQKNKSLTGAGEKLHLSWIFWKMLVI